jgi:hypothetical protein
VGVQLSWESFASGKANLLDLAGADAIRLKVASRDKTLQAVFLLFVFLHFAIYRDLPRVVRKNSIRAVFQRGVTSY